MPGLVGKTLGRYEIVDLLGAGGMGEVYRARDTQLGRPVAIKVISTKTNQSQRAIDRFEREAKTVAQLSHPNILDIHDFGRDDGVVYAVTELLEGEDLRDRMRGSMLPLSKAFEIGIAVANGLAAAHSKGIVHRDIKPENIFVTSTGQVKVLDFGIAGLKGGEPQDEVDLEGRTESLTLAGDVVGTLGYMSPEQVRGETVDPRSDIFALGCLLYEVLTGHRAFRGETSHDTMRAILNRDPDSIADYRSDVPSGIEAVIRRCLEKQPEERFESARDVAFAFQALTGPNRAAVQPQRPKSVFGIPRKWAGVFALIALVLSFLAIRGLQNWMALRSRLPEDLHIAVMPFEFDPNDPGGRVYADGLAEHIASGLTLLEQHLPPRYWIASSQLARRMEIETIDEMLRKFNVTLVVTGRLTSSGDQLRLDLGVVDPRSSKTLRSFSILDQLDNVYPFQHQPVIQICELLELELTDEARDLLAAGSTTMASAFDSYVRGVGVLVKANDPQAVDLAVENLSGAKTEDPLFADARIALGNAYLRNFESTGSAQWIEEGLEETDIASSTIGRLAEALSVKASLHRANGDVNEAIAALERATRAAPDNADAHSKLGKAYESAQRYDDAERAYERAAFLRPGWWIDHLRLAFLNQRLGRYEAAATQFRSVIETAPESRVGYTNLGRVLFNLGKRDEAKSYFEKSLEIEPTYTALLNLGVIHFEESRFADAATMFERALELDDSNYLLWGNLGYARRFASGPEDAGDLFRRASELAELALEAAPQDARLMTDIAGYCAMLGEIERGFNFLQRAIEQEPIDPELIASIAEAFEDLGDRDNALEWVGRAFDSGVRSLRFDERPTLRELIADQRYRALVEQAGAT